MKYPCIYIIFTLSEFPRLGLFSEYFSIALSNSSHSFIHSFILVISITPLQVLYYSEALPTTARILYRSFTPSAQATAGKGLAQGPYVTARAGVEPTTLRLKVIASTNAPSRHLKYIFKVQIEHCLLSNISKRSSRTYLCFQSSIQKTARAMCWMSVLCCRYSSEFDRRTQAKCFLPGCFQCQRSSFDVPRKSSKKL